jgi:hypothetical protein
VREERVDVVYTWVDGSWPGYADELARHAERPVDTNPNRYRDNLDLLKYSLRSLEAHAPWLGQVVLVTARPQRPRWLRADAAGLRVVHHDEIFDAAQLPTFSSFAIECCLHRIPGLAARYVYFNDDMLLGRQAELSDLADADGRALVYLEWRSSDAARARHPHPWEAATGVANALLDARFGAARRRPVRHVPILMELEHWRALTAEFAGPLEGTRAARFRSPGTVAPDQLYPHYCLLTGRARAAGLLRGYAKAGYLGLENAPTAMALALRCLRLWRPVFLCLNDGFGEQPDPDAVARVREFLEGMWPRASRFEAA